jgi:hypothetical protein
MANNIPHEYTREEMLIMFLHHIKAYKDYWSTLELEGERDTLETRMSGLCFSFLTMLDGVSVGIPALEVIPVPHPTDEEYLKAEGDNWWPNQSEKFESSGLKSIAGSSTMLHDLWHDFCRGKITLETLLEEE